MGRLDLATKGFISSQLSFTEVQPHKVKPPSMPRWCILGRSNVGKSTFLNTLTHPKKIFRTGRTPGVTQGLIGAKCQVAKNDKAWIEIVDTPGFGFVKRKSSLQSMWGEMLQALQETSAGKSQWIWLLDPLRKPMEEDWEILNWLGHEPFLLLFSKSDKVKSSARGQHEEACKEFIEKATEKPIWFSSKNSEGLEQVSKAARAFCTYYSKL